MKAIKLAGTTQCMYVLKSGAGANCCHSNWRWLLHIKAGQGELAACPARRLASLVHARSHGHVHLAWHEVTFVPSNTLLLLLLLLLLCRWARCTMTDTKC